MISLQETPNLFRVKVIRIRFDVQENRNAANPRNCAGRGKKGEGRGYHVIARLQVDSHQWKQQGIGTGSTSIAKIGIAVGSHLFLKIPDFITHNEVLAIQDLLNGCIYLIFNGFVLAV